MTKEEIMTLVIQYGVLRAKWQIGDDMSEMDSKEMEIRKALDDILNKTK